MIDKTKMLILKKYPETKLKTCGNRFHKKGCYLSLKDKKVVTHSEEISGLVDYDKNNNIVGIDLRGFSY